MENINYLDALLGGVVILSALIGLSRGLVKEVLSLIAWAVAIYVAWRFADQIAADHIRKFIDDTLISYLAAFGILFLVTLFVVGLFNMIVAQLLTSAGLSGFDRFLGMLFGLARGLIIGALVVFVIGLTPFTKEEWWQTSRLEPGFTSLGSWGWGKLPTEIRQLLRSGGETVAEAGTHFGLDGGIKQESTGQNNLAERPEQRVSGEQRNAISNMSDAEIRLESLSNEYHQSQQSQAKSQKTDEADANNNDAPP